MKKSRVLAFLALTIVMALVVSGCNLFGSETVNDVPGDDDTPPAGKSVVVYIHSIPDVSDPDSRKDGFVQALRDVEFEKVTVVTDELELASAMSGSADVLVVFQNAAADRFSNDFATEYLKPYLESGGLVVVSSGIDIPLNQWIGEDAAVTRIRGMTAEARRKTSSTDEGDWVRVPHDLESVLRSGVTPLSGFTPGSDKWEPMALRLHQDESQEDVPYLLRYSLGDGHLVLTSSALGLRGGNEMFGNNYVNNAAKLVDNLLHQFGK